MINATDLRNGAVFKEDNQILQVINYEHIKMGRGSGTIKVKVKNLKTGSIVEKSFITGARVEEADVEKRKAQFLYQDKGIFYFMDSSTFEQFPVDKDILGEQCKYLKEGLDVIVIVSEEQALGIELPNSLIYTIIDTGPAEKGNTVSNVFKSASLDNGLEVKVPMFSKVGDRVKVDTRTGQYIERVSK